jgi:hypothetical protein
MVRTSVNSSSIKSIGYDAEARTLEVEMVDGDVYQYFNVAPQVHRDLANAASIGQYFAYYIKTTYRWRKVA